MNAIHPAMSRQDYDSLDRAHFSRLRWMERSPGHYRHAVESGGGEDTDARKRGRVVHLAVFEPDRLPSEVVVWEGARRAGKEWDAFETANTGKEILTVKDFEAVKAISLAVRNSPQAAPYLEDGQGEVSMVWESSGLPCKGRMDWVAGCGAIVDLKSTKDASPEGFGREVANYLSHAQAAFYVDGYEAATKEFLPYILIAVEPVAPFAVQVYRVSREILAIGRDKYRGWLQQLEVCRREDKWPGYSPGELELQLPRWSMGHTIDGEVP